MNTGTPEKLMIDGVTYDMFGDTNITFNPTKFEREGIATTGKTVQKTTKRVKTKEGVTIAASSSELEILTEKSDSLASKTFSVTYADMSVWRAVGQFNIESWESEEGRATIQIIPDGDWTPFNVS